MSDYDFHQLSPYDFEIITRDLLQARDGFILESFKTGRDGGIDFRHASAAKGKIIVQCKHYQATGIDGLLASLRKEVPKVLALNPDRYIVVTSLGLTPNNKGDIASLFGPYITSTDDIVGRDDLNNYLGLYKHIETAHYKLWLASTNVLQVVLNNAEKTRSDFEVQRIYRNLKKYVQSGAYKTARDILDEHNVLIISGQPGVGKTTLAEMLMYERLEKGAQPIVVNSDIEEARKQFNIEVPQIFYYDDFLGASFLGQQSAFVGKNHDRDLLRFVEMVSASKTSRLILTTREHILQQAMAMSERVSGAGLIDRRCVLDIRDYSLHQKARILYNHIYFSDLPRAYREALLAGGFYRKIIDHGKFNPRLVEWLSSYSRVRSVPPDKYQAFVLSLLDNPAHIWLHAYTEQLSDSSRSMLLALHSMGGAGPNEAVLALFGRLNEHRAQKYNYTRRTDDQLRSMKELTDAFVGSTGNGLQYINPSVGDLMTHVIREQPENGVDIIASANRFREMKTVIDLSEGNEGKPLREALFEKLGLLIDNIATTAAGGVYVQSPGGLIRVDIDHDDRLSCLARFAEQSRNVRLLPIIDQLIAEVIDRVSRGYNHIEEAADLVDLFSGFSWSELSNRGGISDRLRDAMLKAAENGAPPSGLRRLIEHVTEGNLTLDESQKVRLEAARDRFFREKFSTAISECTSTTAYSELEDAVRTIGSYFAEDVSWEIEKLNEASAEFEANEEMRADATEDDWKERHYAERSADQEISEMFASLSSDE
ncbi:restriction endonuclease [Mesorhizobium sp. BH1-1-4]|uniref:nSTAND3 domain-containing NTPase n=1 Tax=Mesorhizobium sp. BH1-1-4 TaxID=2876662 RepID=UPI001CD078CE|nr:restriction endonuclease [Mesorhizobium sp. BH1-1-4]MBZ9996235.1 restriction endonuclease [Mesorhizobium sp. BH1-1-4]